MSDESEKVGMAKPKKVAVSPVQGRSGPALDSRFDVLREIMAPMAQALGPDCELILHDYHNREHSVVAVAGDVTHRSVGSAMSEIGLSVLAEGENATNRINYLTHSRDGRTIKSSTIVLRDAAGRVAGALCINTDVTRLRHAADSLARLIGEDQDENLTTFSDDIREVIDNALREQLGGRHAASLSRAQRLAIFRALDERGVFGIKRSLSQVAARLGVSRATGYTYLKAIAAEKAARKEPEIT